MKILISADMEGITGVTTWEQVTPGTAEYGRFRRFMTSDVNAAARGAYDGGADEVVVTDAHEDGSNILVEDLDPRARLNAGPTRPLAMMQGVDGHVDGVIFIGYHARQGSQAAVLDHTWSSKCVHNVWVNDVLAGEYTLNAALAGDFGVPVIMASGDQTACAQIAQQLGPLTTVVVKQASGRFSAECLPPVRTAEMIEQAAKQSAEALKRKSGPAPYVIRRPISVRVELHSAEMADGAMHMPGMARDGLQVSFVADDMIKAYTTFIALVDLAHLG